MLDVIESQELGVNLSELLTNRLKCMTSGATESLEEQAQANITSFEQKCSDLYNQYPDEWVVYDEGVIHFHGKDFVEALSFIEEKEMPAAYLTKLVSPKSANATVLDKDRMGWIDQGAFDEEFSMQAYRVNEERFHYNLSELQVTFLGKWVLYDQGKVVHSADEEQDIVDYAMKHKHLDAYITQILS